MEAKLRRPRVLYAVFYCDGDSFLIASWDWQIKIYSPILISKICIHIGFSQTLWKYRYIKELVFGNHVSTLRYLYLTLAGSEKAVQHCTLLCYLFKTSANFYQTRQKHRELSGHKFISNQWPTGLSFAHDAKLVLDDYVTDSRNTFAT